MKPKIFTYTAYRLPNTEDIDEINNAKLSAKEIFDGFSYTLIGRGILSNETKSKIVEAISMLINSNPENLEYQKALEMAKSMKGRFVSEENKIKGGKADKLSVKDIADKFGVSVSEIEKQLRMGVKVESEHTNSPSTAKEIAMDHLSEMPDYYTRLDKMEKEAEKHAKKLEMKVESKQVIKRLLRENLPNHKKKKRMINESTVNGKTIINVDIQPEYQKHIGFLNNWVRFINDSSTNNRIVFLYNGADTLGMVGEGDYKMWLLELGVDEDVIDNAIFYDKGYAFFRYCMDNNIDESVIANLVKFMIKHNINDSREIDENMWNAFIDETNYSVIEVRELLESADDMINIPDLMDFISRFNNIVLTGGGINECLKEVEIALLALDKPFNILAQYTY